MSFRIGHGYDIHRTVAGRALVLGGVKFEADFGLDGHSDADCVTHAICDAFLGAAGLPDIGNFFPDTDTRWLGVDSQVLLKRVIQVLRENGWVPVNLDATVIAERPRIASRIIDIKAALAQSTGLPSSAIGIKATTNEGSDDIGKGLAIAAHAVALIERA
ncbi:MAG TPA: 2-C-methyl-D-erythritol 2,4-cyclodiphosphate synthase [Opitutaceae bacterium]|jgi:2-C-methyl-D-erythritol 2,4-cyclodiphosphate synthase|nr:2-C-methyl-D-erythritol 2,4-cyclodiphosphate synthase [Opitutaceae bacterium]